MIKSFITGGILAFAVLGWLAQMRTQDRPVHHYPPIESPWRNNFGAMP